MTQCPMCHRLRQNCPGYMSRSCTDAVFESNPDFGVRVLEKVITQGDGFSRANKIREFIRTETVEGLQRIYEEEDVSYICRMLRRKSGVDIDPNPFMAYLRKAGFKFRGRGKRKPKKD